MTNDITALVDYYEREKGLDREKVVEALQYAFLSAYKKMVPGSDKTENLRADIDLKKGIVKIFATLQVVEDEELTDKYNQVPLSLAQKRNPESQPGENLEFNTTPKDFGRIAVQTAKQTMLQRLRMAEKVMMYEEFRDRAGDIISGTVRRFERGDVVIDLGKFEGLMPNRQRVNTEEYNLGDRIRVYVAAVENGVRGPEIILSRSHPNLVRRLFESEVSEIADQTIELKGIAREPGFRTKIVVQSNDPKVDPVGACVGIRGARVKNIVRELNNEKVDIIEWSDDVAEMVTQALKPANLRSITIDDKARVVHVTVDAEELPKAIGRRGQNARLTSQLLGWDIQVREDHSAQEKFTQEIDKGAHGLAQLLEIEDEVANRLFRAGGIDLNMVSAMDAEYISEETGLSQEEAAKVLSKAQQLVTGA